MTHVFWVRAAVDRHHQHVDGQGRCRVNDRCGVLWDPAGVQRPGRQRRAGSVCRDGIPELAVRCERTILDGQRKLAHLVDGDDTIVSRERDAGKLRAVGDAWELLANEVEAGETSKHICTSETQPAASRRTDSKKPKQVVWAAADCAR